MNIEKLKNIVVNFLGTDIVHNDFFTNTYDDEYFDLEVKMKLKKIEVEEVSYWNKEFCKVQFIIYLKVEDITIGFNDESESGMLEDDIPSYAWDDMVIKYEDDLYDFLPLVCPKIKLIF